MSEEFFTEDLLMLVTHDLRSPISAIQGYVELIQKAGDLNPLQARYCERVIASLGRMDALIDSVIDMAMVESGKLNVVDCDLGEIVRQAVELVDNTAEQRNVSIQVSIADNLGTVQGDTPLLGHVMNNLLTNSIKYNREGGEVWVTVSNLSDFVRIDVKDSGLGIPEGDQASIFEKGFRAGNSAKAKAAGSGLGLALVRAIIQKHRGYIWFESVEGEGSTFSFTLPQRIRPGERAQNLDGYATNNSEGWENYQRMDQEHSIEDVDVIDDNTQESRDSTEIDGSNDVV